MPRLFIIVVATLLVSPLAVSEEPKADDADQAEVAVKDAAPARNETKTMSGMSILGNEEAPKSLVIIPWNSSEIGTDLNLLDSLDDRAKPVDKDVFLRELHFYRIRAGK